MILDQNNISELFKFQLLQEAKKKRNNKIKLKKSKNQFPPISIEKKYYEEIKRIIGQYIKVTVEKIKPLLTQWNIENKIIRGDIEFYKKDDPSDNLNEIDKEYEKLLQEMFGENSKFNLENILFFLAIDLNIHNNKQWQKVLKSTTGIEFLIEAEWENPVIKAWINRNVNLIKGLSEEYRKKIKDTILLGWERGITADELTRQLTTINKDFYFKRARLIARDQINKLNGVMNRRRQLDAGIELYKWHTAIDERVRGRPGGLYPKAKPSHWNMEGKICRWDNPTLYTDSVEEANNNNWKSRSSINGVLLHPGEDIQCRCFAEPILDNLIEEINKEGEE